MGRKVRASLQLRPLRRLSNDTNLVVYSRSCWSSSETPRTSASVRRRLSPFCVFFDSTSPSDWKHNTTNIHGSWTCEWHCENNIAVRHCARVRGKRQMSDRIILSVTTVQKTQNRKTLGGDGGGGAVPTPHSPLPSAVGQLGATGGGRALGSGRGAKREEEVSPTLIASPLCEDKMTQCRHRRNTATLWTEHTRSPVCPDRGNLVVSSFYPSL